jgi:hypothetical protein
MHILIFPRRNLGKFKIFLILISPATYIRALLHMCSLYRGFFVIGTEKIVHCSELGGVHYIEVHLQQKLIGGTGTSVQTRGVHFIEVFTKGGFTVVLCIA